MGSGDMIMMIQSWCLPRPQSSLLPAAGTVIQVLISHEAAACPPLPPSLPPSLSHYFTLVTLSPVYTLTHNTLTGIHITITINNILGQTEIKILKYDNRNEKLKNPNNNMKGGRSMSWSCLPPSDNNVRFFFLYKFLLNT